MQGPRERERTTEKIHIIAHNQGGRGDTRIKTVQGPRERGRTTEKIYILSHTIKGGEGKNKERAGPERGREKDKKKKEKPRVILSCPGPLLL